MTSFLPSVSVLLGALLGMLLYYIFEFKTKISSGFSLGAWLKDNWWKILLLSPLCLFCYIKYVDASISETSVFFLGFGVTKIIDYFQDLFNKAQTS